MGTILLPGRNYEQALTIRKEVLGDKHPATAISLNTWDTCTKSWRLCSGPAHLEQSLAIRKEVLVDKHPDTAVSLSALGYLHQVMGDYAAARP